MSDFLHKLVHSSQGQDVDSLGSDVTTATKVVDSISRPDSWDDDIDYEALRRDTRWVWGSSYSL